MDSALRTDFSLVTLEEFAEFLRSESYFKGGWWDRGWAPVEIKGADEVLRRIGFSWSRRMHPVRNVSWYEAYAYCKSAGGRLPWFKELTAGRPLAANGAVPQPGRRPHSFDRWAVEEPARHFGSAEWCADWYASNRTGPAVVTPEDRPATRRVSGWQHARLPPGECRRDIGFRVTFSA